MLVILKRAQDSGHEGGFQWGVEGCGCSLLRRIAVLPCPNGY
ncbi:hypothetical protein [Vulcanisaeta sp. JCM 16159]